MISPKRSQDNCPGLFEGQLQTREGQSIKTRKEKTSNGAIGEPPDFTTSTARNGSLPSSKETSNYSVTIQNKAIIQQSSSVLPASKVSILGTCEQERGQLPPRESCFTSKIKRVE